MPPCQSRLVLVLVMSLLLLVVVVLAVAGTDLTDLVSLAAICDAADYDDLLKMLTDPGMPQKGVARRAIERVPVLIGRPPYLAASRPTGTFLLAFRLRSPPTS